MAKAVAVHSSANGSGQSGPITHRQTMPAKPLSRLAKPANGSGTHQPSRTVVRTLVAPSKPCEYANDDGTAGAAILAANVVPESTAVVVRELRPRQILAASLLVSGKRGVDVAATIGVSPETLSRWKHLPEFDALMRELLQQHVDAVRLGMIALTGEAISQLHNLLNSFSDQTSLKACALVLGKAAPILGVVNAELRRTTVEGRR